MDHKLASIYEQKVLKHLPEEVKNIELVNEITTSLPANNLPPIPLATTESSEISNNIKLDNEDANELISAIESYIAEIENKVKLPFEAKQEKIKRLDRIYRECKSISNLKQEDMGVVPGVNQTTNEPSSYIVKRSLDTASPAREIDSM